MFINQNKTKFFTTQEINIAIHTENKNYKKGFIRMQTTNNMNLHKTISCIFMTLSEFQTLITELTDGLREITYELDGISFHHTDKAEKQNVY